MENTNSRGKILESIHVLVADDIEANRKLLGIILELHGANVYYAVNGKEAVEKATNGYDIDVISMDIQMPILDGVMACKQIKQFHKNKGTDIPIMATTSYALSGDRERFLGKGFDKYQTNPLDVNLFVQNIFELYHQDSQIPNKKVRQIKQ